MRHLLPGLTLLLATTAGAAQAQTNPQEKSGAVLTAPEEKPKAAPSAAQEKIGAALTAIKESYVDTVRDEALADAAIQGMLTKLDPHSQYYSREQIETRKTSMSGSFVGIGIQYAVQHDTVYVTQILPGGPAERAGLLAGDRITQLDDERLATTHPDNLKVQQKIRGVAGTKLRLEVYRGAQPTPINLTLTRGAVPDNTVRAAYMATPTVGYIALGIFGRTTRAEMDEALENLKKAGMQSLILDLQGNGGGYVEAAIGVADEFMKRDQMVYYTIGLDQVRNYYYTSGQGHFITGRVVVLTDQATASSSELATSALQDWDRALIVGRRTFGKGLMQRPIPLPDGSVLELSGARFYAPSGRSLQKPYKGVNYQSEVSNRYTNGEMYNAKFIPQPKTPAYKTLVDKRSVYGGLGVVPDVYVPLDSARQTNWLQLVSNVGVLNQEAFEVVNKQRAALLAAYPTPAAFATGYQVPAPALTEVLTKATRASLPLSEARRPALLPLLALELKGRMATQLYPTPGAYLEVTNAGNASYREALRLLADPAAFDRLLPPAPVAAKPAKKGRK